MKRGGYMKNQLIGIILVLGVILWCGKAAGQSIYYEMEINVVNNYICDKTLNSKSEHGNYRICNVVESNEYDQSRLSFLLSPEVHIIGVDFDIVALALRFEKFITPEIRFSPYMFKVNNREIDVKAYPFIEVTKDYFRTGGDVKISLKTNCGINVVIGYTYFWGKTYGETDESGDYLTYTFWGQNIIFGCDYKF